MNCIYGGLVVVEPSGSYVLEMKHISKSFGGVKALLNVDLSLYPSEILGLVGDNGAGKSTLMNILTGILEADEGEIYLEGRKVSIHRPNDSMKLGIWMIYQKLALVDILDIPSNVFLGKELEINILGIVKLLAKRAMEREAIKVLSPLNIDFDTQMLRKQTRFLSGGQRACVAIGKVISSAAKIIIMDEPTAALGVKESRQFLEVVKTLKSKGISLIYITHRMGDIFEVADRVMVLRRGEVVECLETANTNLNELVTLMVGGGRLPAKAGKNKEK
jgi:D-xylose transport system ATP-binding protein